MKPLIIVILFLFSLSTDTLSATFKYICNDSERAKKNPATSFFGMPLFKTLGPTEWIVDNKAKSITLIKYQGKELSVKSSRGVVRYSKKVEKKAMSKLSKSEIEEWKKFDNPIEARKTTDEFFDKYEDGFSSMSFRGNFFGDDIHISTGLYANSSENWNLSINQKKWHLAKPSKIETDKKLIDIRQQSINSSINIYEDIRKLEESQGIFLHPNFSEMKFNWSISQTCQRETLSMSSGEESLFNLSVLKDKALKKAEELKKKAKIATGKIYKIECRDSTNIRKSPSFKDMGNTTWYVNTGRDMIALGSVNGVKTKQFVKANIKKIDEKEIWVDFRGDFFSNKKGNVNGTAGTGYIASMPKDSPNPTYVKLQFSSAVNQRGNIGPWGVAQKCNFPKKIK